MKRILTLVFIFAFALSSLTAQVTSSPSPIPVDYTGTIVLTFDPTKGNGGMAKATACYSHIGLITASSKDIHDWKYLKANAWGTTSEPEWTKTDDNLWQLTIDNIYTYFSCPATESITAIVMVFHNGKGGTKDILEGKTSTNGDILVYIGKETPDDDIWKDFTPADVVEQERPEGIDMGIYYDDNDPTTVTLATFAAGKPATGNSYNLQPAQHVFLIGDMTDWKLNNDYQLKRDGNYFWITLNGLEAGREYRFQYAVVRADGVKKQLSDLFSQKLLHPDDSTEPRGLDPDLIGYPLSGADGGYVSVLQTGKTAYQWSDATLHFSRPDKNNLVIYELWVYDYTPFRSINGVLGRLDYLEQLGVNAIELMPVNEFDGNYNWGYSPNHYFAFDKAYGSPDNLKHFVDECHARGIAVILDMVFNHATGENPMNKLYPYGGDLKYNPWFNVTAPHKAEDGNQEYYQDWNHDFAPVSSMFRRALQYWLTEYKVDGFRMDLSHGFCGPDCTNRYTRLKEYYDAVKEVSPDAYFIQEYWGGSPSKQTIIDDGMLCWTGNSLNEAYGQLAMGYASNSSILSANNDGYIAYNESHDEERNFYKAKKWGTGNITTDEEARLNRIAAIQVFNTLLNGSHMLYMFGELGYDYSINSMLGKETLDNGYRTAVKERVETLGYLNTNSIRMQQYAKTAQAIQLRTRILPEVFAGDPTAFSLGNTLTKTIQWGGDVFAAANFSTTSAVTVNMPSGTWYNYYEQAAYTDATVTLEPGEVKIFTGKQIALPVIDWTYTDIRNVFVPQSAEKDAYKFFRNGNLYIIRDGVVYDALGRTVRE